jgi:peptide/nickel transport system substrate-binding protein
VTSPPNILDSTDPALAYSPPSWQLLDATCAKLLNYPDKPAPAGSQLEPEVAESLPARSPDGKTYTFTIRKGFRFSPPSNGSVTAETFRYTIERTLSPTMRSPAQSYMGDIVGAKAYMDGKAAHISGIAVHGDRLTVQLVAPAPDLPTRLAMPFFCAVPIGTPLDPKGVRVIPSAGPYYITSYTPGQGLVLERNPNYRGNRPHQVDRFELTERGIAQTLDSEVEAGRSDYALGGVARNDAARLAVLYGAQSPAARRGRQQYFVNPTMIVDFILLNSHRPLFGDVRLRRAVNYAVDRSALARVGGAALPTGIPETPTDQYLPPGMPGFRKAHVYPFTPDVSAARRLAGNRQRTALLYTCDTSVCNRLTQILRTDLGAIGIFVVTTKTLSVAALGAQKGEPYDIALTLGWAADYPDPSDFLNYLLAGGGGGFPPVSDPTYQRRAAAIAMLSGPPRYLAYGKLDVETTRNLAPWIPFGNGVSQDFFSKRIGCQVYQPIYGMDLAALCVRH